MKIQPLQFILAGFIALLIVILLAMLVEFYVFSWFGFLRQKADLCQHKSVTIAEAKDNRQRLSFDYDIRFIAAEMRKKENYLVKETHPEVVVIFRKFDDVIYRITFIGYGTPQPGVSIGTYIEAESSQFQWGGEKCSAPNYVLKEKMFAMIDDLPFTEVQKDEVKQSVKVTQNKQGKLW